MEDFELRRDADKGKRATELLDNLLLKEAFETIEKELTDIWKSSKTSQADLREQAWLSLQGMDRFHAILITWVNNGKIALAEQAKAEALELNKKSLKSLD